MLHLESQRYKSHPLFLHHRHACDHLCTSGARVAALTTSPLQSILEEYLKSAEKDQTSQNMPSELPLLGLKEDGTPDGSGRRIALDWKGDPMIINPGDNMPLF